MKQYLILIITCKIIIINNSFSIVELIRINTIVLKVTNHRVIWIDFGVNSIHSWQLIIIADRSALSSFDSISRFSHLYPWDQSHNSRVNCTFTKHFLSVYFSNTGFPSKLENAAISISSLPKWIYCRQLLSELLKC